MESQDLGPPAAMQIRSVPERIREFYNDLARDEGKITLGELLTRIATGATVVQTTVDGRAVSAVQTMVAASRVSGMTADQVTARIAALAEMAKGIAAMKAAGSRAVGIGAVSQALVAALAEDMRRQGVAARLLLEGPST